MTDLSDLDGIFPNSVRWNAEDGFLAVSAYNSETAERELREIPLGKALARELLVHAMFALEDAGFPIIFTVHDEIVVEHPDITREIMERIMSARPPWAEKLGVPVRAKAWVGKRYRK